MDAHVFRRVAGALSAKLTGSRLEKVHALSKDTTQWSFYGHGEKFTLIFRAHRQSPFLFTTASRVPVGMEPPAFVMRFRKYVAGHRITATYLEWTGRRLWLRFLAGPEDSGVWLCLDLRDGPSLHFEPPQALQERNEPSWPSACDLEDTNSDTWRGWAVLTPSLRRTLTLLPTEERAALLVDLETGEGDLFVYKGMDSVEIVAWPLPEALRAGRQESVYEDPLTAASLAGEASALPLLSRDAAHMAAKPHEREAARLERLLAKLESEEHRLNAMAAAHDDAIALQAALYRFAPDEKVESVTLEQAGHGDAGETSRMRQLALDPRLTVRENMSALFHRARRGKRGLGMLAGRREAVARELAEARERAALAAGMARPVPGVSTRADSKKQGNEKNRPNTGTLPKSVQAFTSSDGLIMLRGRDAKGNLAALKLGKPDDLWVHAEGAAGAHVIVRKNAGQPVPESTLHEAGVLAALKSPYKDAGTASVQCAFVRHVHPMRGKAPGMVRIDRHEPGIVVRIEPDLEERLSK